MFSIYLSREKFLVGCGPNLLIRTFFFLYSMKKTIRKKIMRDLQQAFVGDPKEFTKTEIPPEKKHEMDLKNALNFDPKTQKKSGEQRFLDMLRDSSDDSGMGSPSR